jgi:hypothetical protein
VLSEFSFYPSEMPLPFCLLGEGALEPTIEPGNPVILLPKSLKCFTIMLVLYRVLLFI